MFRIRSNVDARAPWCLSLALSSADFGIAASVDEIVAVKASRNIEDPQHSTWPPQSIQSKAVISKRFQQTSINGRIGFGTRGSEVQILSPRPYKPIKIN